MCILCVMRRIMSVVIVIPFFLLVIRCPPISTLFPYTTLFRSHFPALFDTLSDRLQSALGDLRGRGKLDEEAISRAMREIRLALRSEEHTSELQSQSNLVCRLLLEKKKKKQTNQKSSNLRTHPD